MRLFSSVKDIDNIRNLVDEALSIKQSPYKFQDLGRNKTLGLVFLLIGKPRFLSALVRRIRPLRDGMEEQVWDWLCVKEWQNRPGEICNTKHQPMALLSF